MPEPGTRNPDGILLTFNAGSSSLKFGVFENADAPGCRLRGAVRDIGRSQATLTAGDDAQDVGEIRSPAEAAELVLDRLGEGIEGIRTDPDEVAATGHRVVHGGGTFFAPTLIDSAAFDRLQSLNHLAPLHNPHALSVIEVVKARFPGVPTAAEFDTSFFHRLPETARAYAIPSGLAERYGIRRYGFHGIAHQYMAAQLRRHGKHYEKVVSLHLGQGCSAAALRQGAPVETSMGFTPLEGLVMGTRSGDIDAGIVLFLALQGHDPAELEDLLNRKSGLLGLSGESGDIRELLELESRQHAGARRALAAFCHRINKYVGAYASVLGGIDAIVIGGGIGENSPAIRARVLGTLNWLGVELDAEANAGCVGSGSVISTSSSGVEVQVILVDEERVIADATRQVLANQRDSSRVSGP